MIGLHNLRPKKGTKFYKRRVGRGPGSGWGKTAGRGHKGQKARAGGPKEVWFEGGQTPIYRRLPKRGFHNPFAKEYQIVNLDKIEEKFQDGEVVSIETLLERRLIHYVDVPVKILARGTLSKKLTFRGIAKFSKKALEAIKQSGSTIEES